MPGTRRVMQLGPETMTVSAAVIGGRLVEADTANPGFVKHAGAGSVLVAGVAMTDGQPAGSAPTNPLNLAWARPDVAVAYGPADVDVTFAAAANYMQHLIAAAGGQVTPYIAGTSTYDQIVGRCATPAGVASGAVGRIRLR